jgi:hypothetical protein
MYEEAVRQQIEEVFSVAEESEWAEDAPLPRVATLRDYGMLTSDEGLVFSYPDGSVFTVRVGCYRRPVEPDVKEAV